MRVTTFCQRDAPSDNTSLRPSLTTVCFEMGYFETHILIILLFAILYRFEPSVPEQRRPMTPHIKTVARLFEGDERALKIDFGVGKADCYFPWLLLTSACLSHGAQGKKKENEISESATLSYSNFELGVLFCSRVQGKEESDRLYCWRPARCSCSYPVSDKQKVKLIHMPLPYSCHPTPYQLHSEDTRFAETPFFHEVEPGSAVVGNMKDTPLGVSAINSLKKC